MEPLSFTDLLKRYGEENPPSMIYRKGEDFYEWQKVFRNKLEELRGPIPERVPLSVDIPETVERETYHRHLLKIKVNEFSTLAALLLVPNDIAEGEKRPAILALHGHAEHGMETLAGLDNEEVRKHPYRAYARDAAQAGFVVLCPAWWGWPGRNGHVTKMREGRDKCNVIQTAASMYGLSVLSFHIQDGQAAIDALVERSEVDPERIGCIGHSYGGRTAMWLTAFDERIKACIPSGCMNTFRERSLSLESCGIQYFPGLLQYGDVPEIFSLIAPRPLQLMAGEKDGLLNDRDRKEMIATVRSAYELSGCLSDLDYAVHTGGHEFHWELAEPFLRKYLKFEK